MIARLLALGAVAGLLAACGDDRTPTACEEPDAVLTCPPPVSASCEGELTAVETLGSAEVEMGCSETRLLSDDRPTAGYPVGETTVTFTDSTASDAVLTCATTVTVTDRQPPEITCPADLTFVREAPEQLPVIPDATATDDCSAPVVTASPPPEMLVRGDNAVVSTATDGAGLTSECTTNVEILEAFAPRLVRIISAEIAGDGSTDVTLAWDPAEGADVTGYAIERADTPDGPWTPIAEVGPTVRTHTDDALTSDEAFYRVRSLAGMREGGVSPPLRALSIEPTRYDRRGQSVPTVPFDTTLYGVVRHPRDLTAGPYPLVLMLHGNHGICRRTPTSDTDICAESRDHECPLLGYVTTPNAEGLAYLAETVAAQGYVAVTISGNAMNCREVWILERARLIIEHLRRWEQWQRTSAPPFGRRFVGAVDTTRVSLFGHSRGGEAVAHVPELLAASPVSGVSVATVFSLAPTDYDMPTPTGLPYAVLLPGCDGDVTTNVGTDIFDRSIRGMDDFPRSQVLFSGANHNFFSTEWRVDDSRGDECRSAWEVGGPAQRGMLEGVYGAWLAGTVGGGALETFLRGDAETPEGIDAWADHDLDLRWSHVARRMRIDEFEGSAAPDENLLGEMNSYAEFETVGQCYDNECRGRYVHEKGALRLRWDGMTPIARIGLGRLDASGYGYFTFRVLSRRSTFNTGTDQIFDVRLVDAGGTSATVRTDAVTSIPHLYPHNNPLEIFQSVRVPMSAFAGASPGFDPGALEAAELEFSVPTHTRGSVLISDVAVGD